MARQEATPHLSLLKRPGHFTLAQISLQPSEARTTTVSMASRVAAAILLVCVSTVLAIFARGTGAASPTSSPGATGPPTPAGATQAFGRWLHGRYGSVEGYWTCPIAQRYDNRIDCLAEVHVAAT